MADENGAADGVADEYTGEDERDGAETADDGAVLAVLEEGYALKDERRTGWQLRGVSDPESVAAHSWGVCLLCLVFADDAGVDPDRSLRLAVVHDLPEARVGDVPTRADPADEPVSGAEKHRRERAAMVDLGAPVPVVAEAWEAYERRDSDAARFVKDMDLIDMCLQALVYERQERYDPAEGEHERGGGGGGGGESGYDRLDEFFATAEPRLSTDVGRRLFDRIRTQYDRLGDEDGPNSPDG